MEVKLIKNTDSTENAVIAQMQNMGHEQILFCNDSATGLKAIIAVHNTVLGPALGGTRMWSYQNEAEALSTNLGVLEYFCLSGRMYLMLYDNRNDRL